jgi:hypothetical protein
MADEQYDAEKRLAKINQEAQNYRNRSDARLLILTGLGIFFLGTLAPDNTLVGIGKVAEKTADGVSLGLYAAAVLKLAGVNITDTGRRAIRSIRRQK